MVGRRSGALRGIEPPVFGLPDWITRREWRCPGVASFASASRVFDGLRAVAVVAGSPTTWQGGSGTVRAVVPRVGTVLFGLSGYLITGLLTRPAERPDRPASVPFAPRRRLFPALLARLLLAVCAWAGVQRRGDLGSPSRGCPLDAVDAADWYFRLPGQD